MIIKSEAMCVCEHESWRHVLNHEGCYICSCSEFEEKSMSKVVMTSNEILRLKTLFDKTEKKETNNMFKAILVSKSNHATVRKLTGLDPRHIENKVIVVQEKNPGLGLVEVVQRWVFDRKYAFSAKPSPHHLVEIEEL